MDILPGMLLVFAPLLILGAALVGEACVQRIVRAVRRFTAVRAVHFG